MIYLAHTKLQKTTILFLQPSSPCQCIASPEAQNKVCSLLHPHRCNGGISHPCIHAPHLPLSLVRKLQVRQKRLRLLRPKQHVANANIAVQYWLQIHTDLHQASRKCFEGRLSVQALHNQTSSTMSRRPANNTKCSLTRVKHKPPRLSPLLHSGPMHSSRSVLVHPPVCIPIPVWAKLLCQDEYLRRCCMHL